MNPLLSEVSSVAAEARLGTIVDLAEKAPAAAIALLIVVLLAAYGLVRFDLESHVSSSR